MVIKKNNTKSRVIIAAKKVFAQAGYEAASMSKIASQAKIDKSSLYYFFKNKEDLFAAVTLDTWEKFHKSLINNLKQDNGKNGQKVLSQICQDFIKIFLGAGMSTMRMELAKGDRQMFGKIMDIIADIYTRAAQFLKKYGVRNPFIAQTLISNAVDAYVLRSYCGKAQPKTKEYCDYLAYLIII